MDFDPNQPFTVEDQPVDFDASKPFTVEGEGVEAPSKPAEPEHAMTNMVNRGSLADVQENESRVDAGKTQQLGDMILAASKSKGDSAELAKRIAGQFGVPETNIAWYIDNYRNGKYRGPINFADMRAPGQTVTASPPEQSIAEKVARNTVGPVGDFANALQEGYGNVQADLMGLGAKVTDAIGLTDGAHDRMEQAREALSSDWSDEYADPTGNARPVGKFVGESAALSPLFEVAPFAAEGRVGSVIDNALQGGMMGAVTSRGNNIAGNAAMGAIGGAALSSALHGAADLLPKRTSFSPREPMIVETDNPRVTLQDTPVEEAPAATSPDRVETLSQKTKRLRNERTSAVQQKIGEVTSTWNSDTNFNVIPSTRNLTKAQRAQLAADNVRPKDAQAWVASDGTIHVIADNVHPDEVPAIVFHEVLGHTGLATAFGDGLDSVLTQIHEGNWGIRKEVEEFISKHPELYKGQDQIARATEEVLAMRSEAGRIDTTTWENIKNYIRQFGREKLGLDLRYTDSEVKAILKKAHDAVIAGESAAPSGVRYSLKTYHASPYTFDKFDHSNMGKGEGAQAYGWGTYLTDNKAVQDFYHGKFEGARYDVELPDDAKWFSLDDLVPAELVSKVREFVGKRSYTPAEEVFAAKQAEALAKSSKEVYDDYYSSQEALSDTLSKFSTSVEREVESLIFAVADRTTSIDQALEKIEGLTNPETSSIAKNVMTAIQHIDQNAEAQKVFNETYPGFLETEGLKGQTGHELLSFLEDSELMNGRELSPKQISEFLKENGYAGNKYLDGISRRGGTPSYNYVVFDDAVPKITNRYSLSSYRKSNPNIEKVVAGVKEEMPDRRMTHEDVLYEMENSGLTPSRAMRKATKIDPTLGPKLVVAYRKSVDDVLRVQTKILDGSATVRDQLDFAYNLGKAADLVAKVESYKSDIGRALNFLKLVADKESQGIPRDVLDDPFMSKLVGKDGQVDTGALYRIANQMNVAGKSGEKAVSKLLSDMTKPLPEDYITSLHYSFMLSGLGTHSKNAIGNASLLLMDNLAHTVSSPREAAARWWGTFKAVTDMQTYKDVVTSWKEGHPHHQVSKAEHGVILPSFLAWPQRTLAASDSFFRSLIQSAEYNGQAVRMAQEEGLRGAKLWDRVDELVRNPTPEMIKKADRSAAELQLVSTPGHIGKMLEIAKARPDRDQWVKRAGRFILQNILPFTRVTSNAFDMAVKNSFLGLLTKSGMAAAKAGGAEARVQFARMTMGSAIIGYFSNLYMNGDLRLDPITHQAEVRGKDGWTSLQGLDAVSIHAASVVNAFETMEKAGQKEGLAKFAQILNGVLSSASSSTFGDQLAQVWGMTDAKTGESAVEKMMVSQAGSWSPAALRQVAGLEDDYQRDASGDGSVEGKIEGRIKSGIPGIRETLPVRHDALGNALPSNTTLFGVFNKEPLDNDVQEELNRLKKATGKDVITPVFGKKVSKTLPNPDSRVTQTFQEKVGKETQEYVRQWINSPEWKNMTDEQKVKIIKKISSTVRADTRKEMFNESRN